MRTTSWGTAVCSSSHSTGRPKRCTASTAFVLGVTASATPRDVEVEGVRVDVDEDGAGAAQLDDVGRRRERVGGNDHLVAGADSERQHRQVQRSRARGDDDRVRGAAGLGEPLLELGHLRAHRQHPGRDDLGERGDLGLTDVRRGEADAVAHDVAHVPTGRCSRYQSIVRSSPSSSSTAASNPSSSRALPMFGIRSSTST